VTSRTLQDTRTDLSKRYEKRKLNYYQSKTGYVPDKSRAV